MLRRLAVTRRCDFEVRPAEPSLAQQVRDAVKWWLDTATPSKLWKVMQHGGLSASILVVNGLPQVMVRDDGDAGLLATFGILSGDALADYARQ